MRKLVKNMYKIMFSRKCIGVYILTFISCHNIDRNNNNSKKKDISIEKVDLSVRIDSVTVDLSNQIVLLDTLINKVNCKVTFCEDTGTVFLLFQTANYRLIFPVGRFVGTFGIPPYSVRGEKINDSNIGMALTVNIRQAGKSADGLTYYEFNREDKKLSQLFSIGEINLRDDDGSRDTLYSNLLNKITDSEYIEYEYNIDFKMRKVRINQYYPFKPLPEKYDRIVKQYHIQYQTKTIVDSW